VCLLPFGWAFSRLSRFREGGRTPRRERTSPTITP
jgi:hypothetical protein